MDDNAAHRSIGLSQEKKAIFGVDIVEEAEAIVRCIQDNLKAAKSCQESYANKRC
jgi:hypothetical protein